MPYAYNIWETGPRVVNVYIDDQFDPTAASQLAQGAFNWNTWSLVDCSLIELVGGQTTHFGPEVYAQNYVPPAWKVYIVNQGCTGSQFGGCVVMDQDENGRGMSAKVYIPTSESNSQHATDLRIGYFAWASAHEMGHTFGLFHNYALSPGESVMSGFVNETNGPDY